MITVNGEKVEWHDGMTVRALLQACKYVFPLLIVTIDDTLVQRRDYETTPVPDGANVRVVHLMSGG
jgi:thiamine biosynthesis protein ThiS